ncbi:MAG TPA: hypothetical protein VH702_18500 [Vicinamibacterales bacterium]|jgi:hypothetical protein
MAPSSKFTTASRYSTHDYREAKRDWSQRLLMPAGPAIAVAAGPMARRAGAHAVAARVTSGRRNPNIVGVGIAEKTVSGKPTGVLALKFFVKTKFPKSAVPTRLLLPRSIDGLPVDIEQSGVFRAFRRKIGRMAADLTMPNPRERVRPALPGCSIGFRIAGDQFVMGGTFGALVRTTRAVYVLSNNHVLADENRLSPGAPIFQPALLDQGDVDVDKIAELTRFIRLRATRYNRVDAALAKPTRNTLVGKDVLHIGPPTGTAAAAIDMMVHKFGRTTSYTVGRVASIETDVTVEYETTDFTFENQIIVVGTGGQFSDSGDSGSIILQRGTNKAVGLLFGGSSSHTIANHIGNVLRSLRVRMA